MHVYTCIAILCYANRSGFALSQSLNEKQDNFEGSDAERLLLMTKYFLIAMSDGSTRRTAIPATGAATGAATGSATGAVSGGVGGPLTGEEINTKIDALQESMHTMMQMQQSRFACIDAQIDKVVIKVNSIEAHILDADLSSAITSAHKKTARYDEASKILQNGGFVGGRRQVSVHSTAVESDSTLSSLGSSDGIKRGTLRPLPGQICAPRS